MAGNKQIILVELDANNHMSVTLGTQHEAILALALRKAQLTVDDLLLQHEFKVQEEAKPKIEIPKTILDKLA